MSAAETAWKPGDGLTWCGGEYAFERFDPEYPRAICHDDKGRSVAIDITTAKRVDPATERKRAERLRRKEAGYKRVECWLPAEDVVWADQIAKDNDDSLADIVAWCVEIARKDCQK